MMVDRQDRPPVALGRLDDKSRWHWLDESAGAFKPYRSGMQWQLMNLDRQQAAAGFPFLTPARGSAHVRWQGNHRRLQQQGDDM